MAAHTHGDASDLEFPDRTRRLLVLAAIGLAVATLLGMVLLRPTGKDRPDLAAMGGAAQFIDGKLVTLEGFDCPGGTDGGVLRCAHASIEIIAGPDKGLVVAEDLFDLDSMAPLAPGDKVVMRHDVNAALGFEYQYSGDRQRKPTLFWLAILFAGTVIALGRLKGLAALAGLVASLAVLLWFILPSIIDGRSPLPVALVGSAAIAFLALYLAHGFNPMTTIALFGTLASLALTAVLGVAFVHLCAFSGLATEDASYLQVAAGSLDVRGLLLAGVVIGALGAIDDMTVTQASAVWELHSANPDMGTRRLYGSAMAIGRDHVASTVNTLVLAYAGASMPLLIIFVLAQQSLAGVANTEVVATEIVRTLVGSIGLVAAVPVTTWLAALVVPSAGRGRRERLDDPGRDDRNDEHDGE